MLPFIYLLAANSATADPPPPVMMPVPPIYAISVPPPPPPAKNSDLPPMPKGNPGLWVGTADYPASALSNGESGTTRFTLDIDTDGRVSNCTVTVSSGSSTLDLVTCAKIQTRALFWPARNAKGKKVAGQYSNSVRWVLPKVPNEIPVSGIMVTSFIVDADGNVSDCRIRDMRKEERRWIPCPAYVGAFEPYRNADDEAVAVKVNVTTSVRVTEIGSDPDAEKEAGKE